MSVDATPPAAVRPAPRLLGPFDPVLLGWRSREDIVGAHRGIVTTNGLFRPFALVDGRAAGIWSLQSDWTATYGFTFWTVPGLHWEIGGIFLIALGAAIAGVLFFIYMRLTAPPYFKGETLSRSTPTLVPDQ